MATTKARYYLVQGDTLTTGFRLLTGATYATATAVDLTGCEILWQFRSNVADVDGDAAPILELSTAAGTIATPTTDGRIVPVFTDTSAATGSGNPALADAIFDVQVTYADGTVKTYPPAKYERGELIFTNDVSREA